MKNFLKAKNVFVHGMQPSKADSSSLGNYNMFLMRYGDLEFKNVRFRPGIRFTVPFGFDDVFNNFRIHLGIDRGRRGRTIYDNPIYSPFDIVDVEWREDYGGGYGSLLRLITKYDFEVRIAHIEEVIPEALKTPIRVGTHIAYAGNKGMSTAIHTHTEIISLSNKATILEKVLSDKHGEKALTDFYTQQDATDFIQEKNIQEDPVEAFESQTARRRISNLNQYLCRRVDYHTRNEVTFYNSRALFGM